MQINLNLTRKGWFTYQHNNRQVSVRGQAHIADTYYDTENLAKYLSVKDSGELKECVKKLNGTWAFVWIDSTDDFICLAVDHIRSIQLLYKKDTESSVLSIFDDIANFTKENPQSFDESCLHEYLSSGYVYYNRTLYKDVFSLQAAEFVTFDKTGKPVSERYWRYIPNINKKITDSKENLLKKIDDVFCDSMKRLRESVGDRRIVVPLSGGYDSRLIVNYLYKAGIKKVLCYTYGIPGNGESICSKEVASRLGYEWHFIETTPEKEQALRFDESFKDYYLYMANGTNRPCFQEYSALKSLKDQGIVSTEDIVVPGYYFDYLAGSHVESRIYRWNVCTETYIWENNFFPRHAVKKSLNAIKRGFDEQSDLTHYQFCEGWSWQERLAKFIVNNVRCFEYLGFEWRLPVCDFELFKLWLSIPYKMRHERRYFKEIFPSLVVEELKDAPFHCIKGNAKTVLGALIGKYTPAFWRFLLRELPNRKGYNNQPQVTQMIDTISKSFSPEISSRLLGNRWRPLTGNKLMPLFVLYHLMSK